MGEIKHVSIDTPIETILEILDEDAGLIIDPPVWDPIESGVIKDATDAADPLEEPPGVLE